jgi:hypothetical protein
MRREIYIYTSIVYIHNIYKYIDNTCSLSLSRFSLVCRSGRRKLARCGRFLFYFILFFKRKNKNNKIKFFLRFFSIEENHVKDSRGM